MDNLKTSRLFFMFLILFRKRMSSREALEHEWIKQLDGGVSTQDVILAQRAKRELLSDDVESLPLENQEMISSSGSEASFEKLSDVSEGNTRRSIDNISEKNKDGLREDLSNDQFSEDKAEMADQGTGLLMTETYIENLENERCSNEDSSFKESKKEESTFIRNDERSYAEICKKDEKNNIYDHCKSEVIKRDDEAVDISLVEEEKDKQLENKRGNKKVDGFLDIPAKGEKFNLDVCTERNGENTVSDKDLSNVYDLREGHSTQSTETKTAFGIEKAEISQKEISFTKSNLEESLMDAFWGECEKSHDIKKSVSPKDAGFSVKNKVPNSDNTCYEIEKKKNCHPEFGNDHTTQAKYEQIDKSTYIDSIVGKKNVNFGRVYKKKIPVPIPIRKTEEIPKLLTQSKVKTGTIATKMAKFDQPTEGDLAAKLSSVSKYSSKFERKDTAKNYELASTDLGMKKTKQHMMGFAEIKNDLEKESVRMSRIKSDSVLSDASVLNPTQEVTSTSLKRQSNTGQMLPCSENDLVQPTTFSHCVNDSVIHKDELLGHTSGSNETICEKETPVTNNQSHAISLDKAIHSNKGCLSDGKEKLTPTKAKHKPLIKNPPDIPLKPNKSRIIEDRNKVDANYLSRSEDLKSKIEVDPVKESYDLHKTARTGSGLKFSLNIGGACSSGKKLNIGPLISVGSKNATKEFRHELNNSEPACVKIVDSEENTRESKSESINDARNRSESFLRRRNEEGSNRKTYRRLYVTKVRNSKVYEHDFDISNEAAKIIQRVDKDVLQVEVKLKSTDLKLLP